MTDIGTATPEGALYLPTLGDFLYTYGLAEDSPPLDDDWRLYLSIATTPDVTEWDFTIAPDGTTATIKVESTDIADITHGTKFWLLLSTDSETDIELIAGRVSKK